MLCTPSWLRHCATSRKVAGLIPDEVIECFSSPNPASRTMALGSTQPLTEMSTRNLPGGRGRPVRGADNLTTICEPIVYKMWGPRRLTTLWAFMACYRDTFTLRQVIESLFFCARNFACFTVVGCHKSAEV
jgi:hypothetical protein